ncbi:MAG: hypothetical protein ACE5DM_04440, partial [Candidatus Nanoarchaeia archaeon]
VSAPTGSDAGYACILTQTPHEAEAGEKELLQGDIHYTNGEPALPANLTEVNVSILRINGSGASWFWNTTMVYLAPGVWYYEFDTSPYPDGNYMGVMRAQTSQLSPVNVTCTALFTVSGRGLLQLHGITPDLVESNKTVRIGVEALYNGAPIDASLLQNVTLSVSMINGTNQTFDYGSLTVEDGLIYADGFFDATGVYFLNWSLTYFNRTKSISEVVAVVNFAEVNVSVSVDLSNIEALILDNRNSLVTLLYEMERSQDFAEEEVFLITDAVNSMTRVVNHLNNGSITSEEAGKELNRIQQGLVGQMGDKISGHLVYSNYVETDAGRYLCSQWGGLCWWYWPLILVLGVLVLLVGRYELHHQFYRRVYVPARRTAAVRYDRYREKRDGMRQMPRRYEILLMKARRLWNEHKRSRAQMYYRPAPRTGDGNRKLQEYFNRSGWQKIHPKEMQVGLNRWVKTVRQQRQRARELREKHTLFSPDKRARVMNTIDRLNSRWVATQTGWRKRKYEKEHAYYKKQMKTKKVDPSFVFGKTPKEMVPRRYEIFLNRLKQEKRKADTLRRRRRNDMDEEMQRREMMTRKVKPSEVFRSGDVKRPPRRIDLLAARLSQTVNRYRARLKEANYGRQEERKRKEILSNAGKSRIDFRRTRVIADTVSKQEVPAGFRKKMIREDKARLEDRGFVIKPKKKPRKQTLLERLRPKDRLKYAAFNYEQIEPKEAPSRRGVHRHTTDSVVLDRINKNEPKTSLSGWVMMKKGKAKDLAPKSLLPEKETVVEPNDMLKALSKVYGEDAWNIPDEPVEKHELHRVKPMRLKIKEAAGKVLPKKTNNKKDELLKNLREVYK